VRPDPRCAAAVMAGGLPSARRAAETHPLPGSSAACPALLTRPPSRPPSPRGARRRPPSRASPAWWR
jgi:hypothetical protein